LEDQGIDGIKMDVGEIGWGVDRDWWQAVVNVVMNLQVLVPQN
jgi:hypothetical protein